MPPKTVHENSLTNTAKFILDSIKNYGTTTVISVVLLAFFIWLFVGDLRGLRADVSAQGITLTGLSTAVEQHIESDHALLAVQRQICLSVAKTDDARRKCVE